jgi:hypothetical protein
LKKFFCYCLTTLILCSKIFAQPSFSVATDLSLLQHLGPSTSFFTAGQGVQGIFHLRAKQSAYLRLNYYLQKSFTNTLTATARSAGTMPAEAPYNVRGSWRFTQLAAGVRHYFMGNHSQEYSINAYGLAGIGVLFVRAENTFTTALDTALYQRRPAPAAGAQSFQRMIVDLGAGAELPLGAGYFIYGELRTWIPVSSYPSSVVHQPSGIQVPVSLNLGLRIHFNLSSSQP